MTPDEIFNFLLSPKNFAETMLKVDDRYVKLDPWQVEYLASRRKLTSILKSRRVGGSWIMSVKMFLRSQMIPRYSGTFISLNREEARGKIDYADELYDSLPSSWKLKRVTRSRDEISFTDYRGRRSVLRSLAGKAPRGRGGDVGISELPHCMNANDIYEGALHVTARSAEHHLTIESTPLGKNGVFHDISTGKYPLFKRFEVPWWVSKALSIDIETAAKEAPLMTTKNRVEKFGTDTLKTIYASMPDRSFMRESELEFSLMDDSAFPVDLLMSCSSAEFGSTIDCSLLYMRVDGVPTNHHFNWLARARRGALYAGFDPGRKKDQAALTIVDLVNGVFEVRMTVSMKNTPFAIQRETLDRLMRMGATKIAMDSTGIGMDMSERMERKYRDAVKGVHFTAGSKTMMVTGAYNLFTAGDIVIPAERDLIGELSSIRESVTDAGNVVYQPIAKDHHADMAWALLLAIESARGAGGALVAGYESISKRSVLQESFNER